VPTSWFDHLYGQNPDPWGFETRWYERRKFALTVASLPRQRYPSAFEAGCSIGVLSEALAARCDHLVAADGSQHAVERASERLRGYAHVEVRRLSLPEEWPAGPFELIVLSEIAYYFDVGELSVLVGTALGSMAPGGDLIAVHWRGNTDYPQSGDEAHEQMRAHPALTRLGSWDEPEFLLDAFRFGSA